MTTIPLKKCFAPNVMLIEGLITHFLCFLEFKHRWSLRRVCKTWKRAVNSPACWKVVDLTSSLNNLESLLHDDEELYLKARWVSHLQIIVSKDFEDFYRFLIEGRMINLECLEMYWHMGNEYISLGVGLEVNCIMKKLSIEINCKTDNTARAYKIYNNYDYKLTKESKNCQTILPNVSFRLLTRIVIDCPIHPFYLLKLSGQTPNLQDLIVPRIITCHDCIPCCLSAIVVFITEILSNHLRILQLGFTLEVKPKLIDNLAAQMPQVECTAKQKKFPYEEEGDQLAQLLINKQSESLVCFWAPDVCVSFQLYLSLKQCKNLKVLRLPGWQALENFSLNE